MKIYTDGSCSGNPGPGGWAYVIVHEIDRKQFISDYQAGGKCHTTNNQMELQAVIEALKNTEQHKAVNFYIDSKYVINGITTWLKDWKTRDWKTKGKKPVKNIDQWKEVDKLLEGRDILCHHVRGHSGDKWNEVVDKLAVNETNKRK